jgi:hypothetical protein
MASQHAGVQANIRAVPQRLSLALEHFLPSPQKGPKHWIPTLGKYFFLSHLLDGSTIANLLKLHEYRERIENLLVSIIE